MSKNRIVPYSAAIEIHYFRTSHCQHSHLNTDIVFSLLDKSSLIICIFFPYPQRIIKNKGGLG